jgi:RNA 2',3'-cyclic 3'-phosphodiesterase
MPRLFVALDLPAPPRAALVALCGGVPDARWVSPEQLHLTLRFLGQVAEDQIAPLREKLATVAAPAFRASLQGVGVFPPVPTRRKPARVLWAGVAPPDPFRHLKEAVDAALGPDPESADRTFSPHVTLARFKSPTRPEPLTDYLAQHRTLTSPPFPISAFVLYKSQTHPTGSIYTPLASYPLVPG